MELYIDGSPLSPIFERAGREHGKITQQQALQKAPKSDSMETRISQFLASYRSTPHSVTGRTPAEIILGRLPRTRLSLNSSMPTSAHINHSRRTSGS